MIAGLEDISGGELYIDGKLMNDVEPKDRDIAMVFQSYALYPHMTVYENMAFSLKLKKVPKDEIDRKVRQAAEILDITQYLDRKPKALSGGQRQRVMIAAALITEPKLLIADEPTTALDVTIQSQILKLLKKINERHHTAILFISHDLGVIRSLCDRVIVMNHGTIVESGSVNDVFFHPKEDYTRRLLDAIPNRRTSLRKRIKIAPTAQWPTGSDKEAAPPAEKEE